MEHEEVNDEFTLMPLGTTVFEPDDIGRVVIQFPNLDDSIVFYEFLKAVANGEIKLEVYRASDL